MQDACAWLLGLGLPGMARRAFKVADESERLAVKKAKVRIESERYMYQVREVARMGARWVFATRYLDSAGRVPGLELPILRKSDGKGLPRSQRFRTWHHPLCELT